MGTASTRIVPVRTSYNDPTPEILAGFVRWTVYPLAAVAPARVVFEVHRLPSGQVTVEWTEFRRVAGKVVPNLAIDYDCAESPLPPIASVLRR